MIEVVEDIAKTESKGLICAARGIIEPTEERTLDTCLKMSTHVYVGSIHERIVCAFGLISPSLLADEAYLWLYHLPAMEENKFLFIRHSQRVTEDLLHMYPRIVGHVRVDNPKAIRWLKWLGAKFSEPVEATMSFTIIRKIKHGPV